MTGLLRRLPLLVFFLVPFALGRREIAPDLVEKIEERRIRASGAPVSQRSQSLARSLAHDNRQSQKPSKGVDEARWRFPRKEEGKAHIQHDDLLASGVEEKKGEVKKGIGAEKVLENQRPQMRRSLGGRVHGRLAGQRESNSTPRVPLPESLRPGEISPAIAHQRNTNSSSVNASSGDEGQSVNDQWQKLLDILDQSVMQAALSVASRVHTQSDWIGGLLTLVFFALVVLAFLWWAKKVKLHLRYREIIPGLGKILYKLGVDKNLEFELNMVLQEVSYTENLKTFVLVQADHKEDVSEEAKMGPSQLQTGAIAACFHDAMALTVPQGCSDVKFKLLDKDKKTVLAEGSTKIDKIVKLDDDNLTIFLVRKGKGKKLLHDDPRATISCYCDGAHTDRETEGDTEDGKEKGPPPEKVLLTGLDIGACSLELKLEIEKNSRNRAKQLSIKGPIDEKMRAEHQLEAIAKTCQGKLILLSGFWNMEKHLQFRVFRENKAGSFLNGWKLAWWDQGETKQGVDQQPIDAIPVLYIGKIFPDPNKKDEFTLEYVTEAKEAEPSVLHLIRVDRSREIWVESLSVFINHLRKLRLGHKESSRGKRKEEDDGTSSHKSGGKKTSKRRQSQSQEETYEGDDSDDRYYRRKKQANKRSDTESQEDNVNEEDGTTDSQQSPRHHHHHRGDPHHHHHHH